MQLVSLSTIADEALFPKGTLFRVLNADHLTNPARPAYYDYMLVLHPSEEEAMLVVNVTAGSVKAGYIICQVQVSRVAYFITAAELKRSLGVDGVFYCQYRENITSSAD
jgi:hypothetical protein